MRAPFYLLAFGALACSPRGEQHGSLQGAWTWQGVNCAERRFEFTGDVIRGVFPNENAVMFKVLETYVSNEEPRQVVLDLQLLPQSGMSAEALRMLKDTGGIHTMSLELKGDRIRPHTMSMNGNSAPILPGEPTYDTWSLHRCPARAAA
jgi:hypothetical protein